MAKKKRSREEMMKEPVTMKVPRLAHAIVKILQARQDDDLSLGDSLIQYMLKKDPDVVRQAERALDLELADFNPYKQAIEDDKPAPDSRTKRNG